MFFIPEANLTHQNIYLVCDNTMCVSTCHVDYVLLRT